VEGEIRRLRCTYQAFGGDPVQAAAIAARLDRVAGDDLAHQYSAALTSALGTQPDVYVLRAVRCSASIPAIDAVADGVVSQTWGRRMAEAVLRTIRDDAGDGANLVRFGTRAEFVAQFLGALTGGTAWDRWYFFPFRSVRNLSPSAAVRAVMLANRECLPDVLGILERLGELGRVLRVVEASDLEAVWGQGLDVPRPAKPETFLALFAAAVKVVDRLGAWAAARPPTSELHALFDAYLDTRPTAVDWRDPRELANVVLEILRFLALRGTVFAPTEEEAPGARVAHALADMDWLDGPYLGAHIMRALGASPTGAGRPARPPARSFTPRQQALADDLIEVVIAGVPALDLLNRASASNRLRLYAVLLERAPRWAGDGLALSVIEQLMTAWAWLDRSQAPADALTCLRRHDLDGAKLAGPPDANEIELDAIRFVMTVLGDGAVSVLQALSGRGGAAQARDAGSPRAPGSPSAEARIHYLESASAGVFLLARSLLDARISALAKDVFGGAAEPVPGLQALLASLALRWGGAAAIVQHGGDRYMDDGLALLAGLDRSLRLGEIRRLWSAAPPGTDAAFQEAAFFTLAGLRVLDSALLHLHFVRSRAGLALIAGTQAMNIWPFGRIVTAATVAPTVHRWVEIAQEALGRRPVLVAARKNRAAFAGVESEIVFVDRVPAAMPPDDSPGIPSAYRADRTALVRALGAITRGTLGLPDVDLTVGLTSLSLLRVWGRWLGRFAESTAPYVLEQFIRRRGRIHVETAGLIAALEPRSLDVVLEMAGYLEPLEAVPWLGNRRLRFERAVAV
jgi:hypothetical protein